MHTSNNDELNQEIIEHLMHPKNYGEITPANGIGMGYDAKTQEFVVFYILVNDSQLDNVGYATNGCQDTVVLGSMFTEMIKNDTLENANRACELMRQQISNASAKQQACADMVLSAYEAAYYNYTHHQNEAMHKIAINQSCSTEELS